MSAPGVPTLLLLLLLLLLLVLLQNFMEIVNVQIAHRFFTNLCPSSSSRGDLHLCNRVKHDWAPILGDLELLKKKNELLCSAGFGCVQLLCSVLPKSYP